MFGLGGLLASQAIKLMKTGGYLSWLVSNILPVLKSGNEVVNTANTIVVPFIVSGYQYKDYHTFPFNHQSPRNKKWVPITNCDTLREGSLGICFVSEMRHASCKGTKTRVKCLIITVKSLYLMIIPTRKTTKGQK
jgi:hypothetical protein